MSTEIALKQEIAPVVKTAEKLTIKSAKDMEKATEMLSRLNVLNDQITEEKEKITVPALAVLSAESKRWAPVEKPLKLAIDMVREKIGDYQTEQIEIARAKESKIADKIGEGKLKMETGLRKMGEIEKPSDRVVTDSGSLKFRETQVLEVINIDLVPREYMIIDEKKIMEAMKSGTGVIGCVLKTKMIPVNSR